MVTQIKAIGKGDLAHMTGCPETHGFDVQGGGVRLISGCYLSTFDYCQLFTIRQLPDLYVNRVKDCTVGYRLRILVTNVPTVPDRPNPPQGKFRGCPEAHGFDVQGGGVRLVSGGYLSTFDNF